MRSPSVASCAPGSTTTCSRSSSRETTMREHDSLTRLLATHTRTGEDDRDRGARSRHASLRGSTRFLDDEAKVRILDASLGVLAALRNLADVTEEILRDRRDSLL